MIEIKFEQNRSAAYDGEKLIGHCDFEIDQNIWVANHTFVEKEYAGQGIAKKLLQCVVKNATMQNAKIKPVCSYVVREFDKNPELYAAVKL